MRPAPDAHRPSWSTALGLDLEQVVDTRYDGQFIPGLDPGEGSCDPGADGCDRPAEPLVKLPAAHQLSIVVGVGDEGPPDECIEHFCDSIQGARGVEDDGRAGGEYGAPGRTAARAGDDRQRQQACANAGLGGTDRPRGGQAQDQEPDVREVIGQDWPLPWPWAEVDDHWLKRPPPERRTDHLGDQALVGDDGHPTDRPAREVHTAPPDVPKPLTSRSHETPLGRERATQRPKVVPRDGPSCRTLLMPWRPTPGTSRSALRLVSFCHTGESGLLLRTSDHP
jgi:hypothetical protein